GGPVVHDCEPGDAIHRRVVGRQVAGRCADHAGEFQFVVEGVASLRGVDRIAVPDHGDRVREVEDGNLVPLRDHVEIAVGAAGLDMLLKGIEVADRSDGKRYRHGGYSKISATWQ